MLRRVVILFFILSAFLLQGKAQTIFPPKLECVTNLIQNGGDIQLNWQVPNNSCGAFTYYLVYGSKNGGPYTIVDTVFNQATTSDTITGANGNTNTWYFYLESVYNCPGSTAIPSDTVENKNPVPPVINFISVSGGHSVFINWQPGTSSQTSGYIIYKIVNGRNIPITTVNGKFNTSYNDTSATPSTDTISYVIASQDSCGNIGTISNVPHSTIFLTGNVANCQPTGTISWSPYVGWTAIDHYNVYVSKNGKPPALLITTPATTLTATFSYTSDTLCFYVVAHEANSADTSVSNQVCFPGNSSNPITDFYIRNVTVAGTQVNNILYSVAPNSGIFSIKMLRVNTPGDQPIAIIETPPLNTSIINTFGDSAAVNSSNSYYYTLVATDSCGRSDTSSTGKSILLSGYAFTSLKNSLTWDNGYLQYGTLLEYDLYREPNTLFPIAVLQNGTNTYEEDVSSIVGDTGNLCYVVVAKIAMAFPDGKMDTVYSRSNVICLDQIIQITVPNAFNPEGKNKVFKPVLRFTGDKSYTFEVYNRWGGLIFSTKDFSEGWDGTYNGKLVEQGVYAYDIQVVDKNGLNTERKGTVMVMRQ